VTGEPSGRTWILASDLAPKITLFADSTSVPSNYGQLFMFDFLLFNMISDPKVSIYTPNDRFLSKHRN